MITLAAAALLLQATTATPAPPPAAAPAKLSGGFGAKPVPTVARARARVTITDADVAHSRTPLPVSPEADARRAVTGLLERQAEETRAAQERMDRAASDAVWTANNIQWHEGIRGEARSEWEAAAEACRRTPGCVPTYRPSTILPTGDETLERLHKNPFKR